MDNEFETLTVEAKSKENTNTALMDYSEFDSFVKSKVVSFLQTYNLGKIIIDVGNGYKGKVKVNKNGEIEVEVTAKELM